MFSKMPKRHHTQRLGSVSQQKVISHWIIAITIKRWEYAYRVVTWSFDLTRLPTKFLLYNLGTTVCYSTNIEDPNSWRRNRDTVYSDGQLWWEHEHTQNGSLFFSYFPPYSYSRHLGLVSRCSQYANTISLGQSLDGRDIECIMLGKGKTVCWCIHRQHPGETMAGEFKDKRKLS